MPEEDISSIGNYAIAFGVAVIIVVVITLLVQSIRDKTSIIPDEVAALSTGNETLTWGGNNTAISLREGRIDTGSFKLYNNGSLLNAGAGANANYTVSESSVTIINATPNTADSKGTGQGQLTTNTLNASYSYKFGSSARNTTNLGLAAQNTFASFLPITAMALVGALILGIVLRYFKGKQE